VAKSGPFIQQLRGNYHRESLALIKLMIDLYIIDKSPIHPDEPVNEKELKHVHHLIKHTGKRWLKCNCF
jgi:hypothetical protein